MINRLFLERFSAEEIETLADLLAASRAHHQGACTVS